MIRRIIAVILLAFAVNAIAVLTDWVWFHGLRSCFWFLERHAGYWTLVVVCIEIFFILAAMWKITQWPLFYRSLMASSWLLPSYLFAAYLGRNLSADPKQIHSLDGFYRWQTAGLLQAQQIEAARLIPLASLIVIGLILLSIRKAINDGLRWILPNPSRLLR